MNYANSNDVFREVQQQFPYFNAETAGDMADMITDAHRAGVNATREAVLKPNGVLLWPAGSRPRVYGRGPEVVVKGHNEDGLVIATRAGGSIQRYVPRLVIVREGG